MDGPWPEGAKQDLNQFERGGRRRGLTWGVDVVGSVCVSAKVPNATASVEPRKAAGSFQLHHRSAAGSSRAPAPINSHQRCPLMADKGPSLWNTRARNKLAPWLCPPWALGEAN